MSRAAARCSSTCPTSPTARSSTASATPGAQPTHAVRVEPGTRARRASLGATETPRSTPSTTRPSTALGAGLRAVGWAPDGVDRGDRGAGRPFVLGVQWHAECLVDRPRARARSSTRSSTRRASTRRRGADGVSAAARPRGHWSDWSRAPGRDPYTVGVEEEVMLLDPQDWSLAAADRRRARRARPELRARTSRAETHGLGARARHRRRTPTSARAIARAARRCAPSSRRRCSTARPARRGARARIRSRVWQDDRGLRRASATSTSTARCASWRGASRRSRCTSTSASRTPRTRSAPPTGMRAHLPAAARAVGQLALLAGPRHRPRLGPHAALPGLPARRASRAPSPTYADYVEAVDLLIRCDAFPEPTFLWWDVRLQPRFGTRRGARHGRADARRRHAPRWSRSCSAWRGWRRREGRAGRARSQPPEVLDENRFLAARDGMRRD